MVKRTLMYSEVTNYLSSIITYFFIKYIDEYSNNHCKIEIDIN
jgi:hypothetical protein